MTSSGADAFSAQWRRGAATIREAAPALAARAPGQQLSDAEKIEKHHMLVRRSYYQKKERKRQLKLEVGHLEAQYNALVSLVAQRTLGEDADDWEAARELHLLVCACCEGPVCVRVLYREAAALKEQLQRQKQALELRVRQHHHLYERLAGVAAQQSSQRVWNFQALQQDECCRTVIALQRTIVSHRTDGRFQDVGHPILGWRRQRTLGSASKFSLFKVFAGESSALLADRVWRMYSDDSERVLQLYSGAVDHRFELLQRVDASHLLFCRRLRTDVAELPWVTFFQLSRVETANRHLIVFRSLDPSRVLGAAGDACNSLDMFSWFSFSEREDADGTASCEMEFGGNVPSLRVTAETEFWMAEFLSYLLRIESCLVRPVFRAI